MKFLKIAALALVVVVLFLGIGFLLPGHVHAERSIVIGRSPATVFTVLEGFGASPPEETRPPLAEPRCALEEPSMEVTTARALSVTKESETSRKTALASRLQRARSCT